jgi:uncharacterized protein
VQISFDPKKSTQNLADHGFPLSHARLLAWDEALVWVDERFEYGELRMVALVPQGDRLFYVAFVDRGEDPDIVRWVISLRYAERKEVKSYVENFS